MFSINLDGAPEAVVFFAFVGAILLQIAKVAALVFFAVIVIRAFGTVFSPGDVSYGVAAFGVGAMLAFAMLMRG